MKLKVIRRNSEMDKIKEIKKELKALMEKYSFSIIWICDKLSDLHGVSGSRMEISVREPEIRPGNNFPQWNDYKVSNSHMLEAEDL